MIHFFLYILFFYLHRCCLLNSCIVWFLMQHIILLFSHLIHLSLNLLLFGSFLLVMVCLIQNWSINSCFNIICNVCVNVFCFYVYYKAACVHTAVSLFLHIAFSNKHTKTHKLLFYLIMILIDLSKVVYLWVSVFFLISMSDKFWEKNHFTIIWFWHEIVSSFFCSHKFHVSIFFHIFYSFTQNWIIHQLGKISLETIFCFFS